MSTSRGIFESFPNQPVTRLDSPFAVVSDQAAETAPVTSPFTAAAKQDSPFSMADEAPTSRQGESGKSVKLPDRRKIDGPFQVAEPSEGFGFEAVPRTTNTSPFETSAPAASPFSMPSQAPSQPASPFSTQAQAPSSPFSIEQPVAQAPAAQPAPASFSNWQEPAASYQAPVEIPEVATPVASTPAATQFAPAFSQQAAPQQAVAPAFTPPPAAPTQDSHSDSFSIRQLELRAIFGVDREMSVEEIFQRTRALPGIKNLSRVANQDIATIDAMKALLPNLGFGGGNLRMFAGSAPLEFIREGGVMLAVQTDGGFAPGVREILMLVARELNRNS